MDACINGLAGTLKAARAMGTDLHGGIFDRSNNVYRTFVDDVSIINPGQLPPWNIKIGLTHCFLPFVEQCFQQLSCTTRNRIIL